MEPVVLVFGDAVLEAPLDILQLLLPANEAGEVCIGYQGRGRRVAWRSDAVGLQVAALIFPAVAEPLRVGVVDALDRFDKLHPQQYVVCRCVHHGCRQLHHAEVIRPPPQCERQFLLRNAQRPLYSSTCSDLPFSSLQLLSVDAHRIRELLADHYLGCTRVEDCILRHVSSHIQDTVGVGQVNRGVVYPVQILCWHSWDQLLSHEGKVLLGEVTFPISGLLPQTSGQLSRQLLDILHGVLEL